jgi:hypothetical protein
VERRLTWCFHRLTLSGGDFGAADGGGGGRFYRVVAPPNDLKRDICPERRRNGLQLGSTIYRTLSSLIGLYRIYQIR